MLWFHTGQLWTRKAYIRLEVAGVGKERWEKSFKTVLTIWLIVPEHTYSVLIKYKIALICFIFKWQNKKTQMFLYLRPCENLRHNEQWQVVILHLQGSRNVPLFRRAPELCLRKLTYALG
jgi:hypothetical protein